MNEYLAKNKFLADINNEYKTKNEQYQKRLSSLDKFVMYSFELDDTIVPVESTWFGWKNKTMEETSGYEENWIGLRTLNEQGKIERRMIKGMKHVLKGLRGVILLFRRTFQLDL
jgi:palmitoyl-protein thioesterase